MRVLAIDPGLHAAACMYQPTASLRSGMRWQFLEVPVIPGRKRPDARVLRDWIMRHGPADRAFVENVSGMPGDGVKSMSVFMRATGYVEATVQCCDVQMIPVAPLKWKNHHRMLVASSKEDSRLLAIRLAPELADVLALKKSHNFAEAALLAMYGAACLAPILPPDGE